VPTYNEILNWLIVMLGLMSIWYQWRAYRILRSPAFVILTVALIYLTAYRAALPFYPSISGYGVALPFYLLMVVHGILMTRSLTRVLEAADTVDCNGTLEQADRPLWKPGLDYVSLAVIVTAIVAVVILEVLQIWGVVH
jgi:hypothetical protein